MKPTMLMIVALLAVQLADEGTSAAYQLDPISQVFAPSGSKATQSFQLVNTGKDRVALTISFATLERDAAYTETNHDADDEFLAYPSQIVLAAGARQTVRVTWLGTPNPAHELAYRIIVTQVPIGMLDRTAAADIEAAGQVRVLVNYRGTVFIRPPHAAPNIALESAVRVTDAHGKAALAVTVANLGTAVGLVKSCAVRVAAVNGGPDLEVPAAVLAPLQNTRVLARSRRRFVVAWPPNLSAVPVKGSGRCTVAP